MDNLHYDIERNQEKSRERRLLAYADYLSKNQKQFLEKQEENNHVKL